MKILFVCMGNTCRSPMAKVIAEKMLAEKGKRAVIESAGLCADFGRDMSQNARLALQKRFGNEPFFHASRRFVREDLERFDRIITLTRDHKDYLETKFGPSEKILAFPSDIADPWGGFEEDYEKCAENIEGGLSLLLERGIFDD